MGFYIAGFQAVYYWDNPPAGFLGATAELNIIGAYLVEIGYKCWGSPFAALRGTARMHITQGMRNPLNISEAKEFIFEEYNEPGWNEGSIGFAGPIPMNIGTINLSVPQNQRVIAGSPICGIVQVEFDVTTLKSRVLIDFNSQDHLKINFTGLTMTINS